VTETVLTLFLILSLSKDKQIMKVLVRDSYLERHVQLIVTIIY